MPLRNEQVQCAKSRGDTITKKHMQNDDICQFNVTQGKLCSSLSYVPFLKGLSEDSLSNKSPSMKSLGHSKKQRQKFWEMTVKIQNSFALEF